MSQERAQQGYKALWVNCMTAAGLVGSDGRFLSVNPAYCRLLEYTEAELLARTFQQVTIPGDAEVDEEMSGRVAAGKIEGYDMVKGYLTKSQRVVMVRLRVDAMRSPAGEFICFLAQAKPLETKGQVVQLEQSIPSQVAWLVWAQKNWPILLWILSGLTALLGAAIKLALAK